MRVAAAGRDFAFLPRLFLALVRRISKEESPDVVKVHLYRPGVYGRWASPAFQDVMRGPSGWSTGERELFAAYTSRLLQCPF